MSEKKSFILYDSYYEQVMMLSVEERGQLLTAIYEYESEGEVRIEMSPVAAMAFSFIRSNMDRDRTEYEERCAKNRANGKRGGRPKKEESKEEKEETVEETVKEEELIREGIPTEYISERVQRARAYAKQKGVSAMQIIRSWWQSDKRGVPPRPTPKAPADDTDDWYQAKLRMQFGGCVSGG